MVGRPGQAQVMSGAGPGLIDVLTLERIEADLFRSSVVYDDEIMHACALTYISDIFTGLASVPGIDQVGPVTSVDHAVWFHRKAGLDDWVLMDLLAESTAGGRGMYTGRIFSRDGRLAAGLPQESLFRPGTRRRGPLAD